MPRVYITEIFTSNMGDASFNQFYEIIQKHILIPDISLIQGSINNIVKDGQDRGYRVFYDLTTPIPTYRFDTKEGVGIQAMIELCDKDIASIRLSVPFSHWGIAQQIISEIPEGQKGIHCNEIIIHDSNFHKINSIPLIDARVSISTSTK